MNVLSKILIAKKTRAKLSEIARSPLAVTLVLALLGLLILEQVARWQEPPRVALDELAGHEGRTVVVTGIVTDTRPLAASGWQLELTQGDGRTTVFAPGLAFTPFSGDLVEARGVVEWYRNRWQINCQAGEVNVVASPGRGDLTLVELARAPEAYLGASLTLRGVVETPHEGPVPGSVSGSSPGVELILYSHDGQHGLNVSIAPSIVGALPHLSAGDPVAVQGELEYRAQRFHYRLRVHAEGHGLWPLDP